MKLNIKKIIFLTSFLFFAVGLFSQAYDDLFFYAKSLDQSGAYNEAELEYKRYLFMQNYAPGNYQAEALSSLASLYEKKEDWSFAALNIEKALIVLENSGAQEEELDALRLRHIQYLAKEARQKGQWLSENLFIFSYMMLPDFSDQIKKEAWSAAITDALLDGRIEYAQKSFTSAAELLPQAWPQDDKTIIFEAFEKLSAFKPKNQKLAAYLSFIPGLGQLYAKDYKDSLNAFLLNGSLIAVSVWSLCSLDFWTFSLLEFNPLFRFMQGNIYNAQKDAYLYNQKSLTALSKPILEALK